jgi:tRNA pseudouridine55 synthase
MKARGLNSAVYIPRGLILLRKTSGLTSFDSLKVIKKSLSTAKVGHTGTLDKFASGLLLVLIGQAGKLCPWFSFCDKEYLGQVRFGIETETLDPEGDLVKEAEPPSREAVEAVLQDFRGNILQAPPAYSAIHIDGKRAHELSRQGLSVEMKKRPVTIHELELISWDPPFAEIRICCSTGTYIRSLARDIAQAAGSCAHLSGLVRTRIGGFHLSEAFEPAENETDKVKEAVHPIAPWIFEALGLPYIFVDEKQAQKISHGQSLKGVMQDLLNDSSVSQAPVLGVFTNDKKDKLAAVLEQKTAGQWSYGHVFADH